MKKYTEFDIINEYNKLSASRQVPILWDALDHMARCNGGRKSAAIMLAMGYTIQYGEDDTYYIKTP